MDIDYIKKLIKLLNDSDLASLNVKDEKGSVELTKNTGNVVQAMPVHTDPIPVPAEQTGNIIKAPIVGIAHRKPKPEATPFVKVGQEIKKGQTVCLVEAMKMFNEVKANFSGTITEILFEDGQLVEFDMPLFKVG